jgi:hypothetical protein
MSCAEACPQIATRRQKDNVKTSPLNSSASSNYLGTGSAVSKSQEVAIASVRL